jgi:hypothetical protein
MSAINWTNLFKDYKGQWVALKDDEKTVVAHGKNAAQVMAQAREDGYDKPILFKVPLSTATYIG